MSDERVIEAASQPAQNARLLKQHRLFGYCDHPRILLRQDSRKCRHTLLSAKREVSSVHSPVNAAKEHSRSTAGQTTVGR